MGTVEAQQEVIEDIVEDMEVSEEVDDSPDDWDDIEEGPSNEEDNSGDDIKSEDSDSDDDIEETPEKSEPVDTPVADTKEEDSEGKEESDKESGKEELIEVKVDGNLEKVTLEELKNNYSGKVAFDKKFSTLGNEKKALETQVEGINTYVSNLGETMKNVSVLEGLYEIGKLNDMGPHVLKQAVIREILPEINRLTSMNDDQIQLEFQQAELAYNKQIHESKTKKMDVEQSQAELDTTIKTVMESGKIDVEEWDAAVKHLDATLPVDRNDPDFEELTPDLVGQYVNFERAGKRADETLNNFRDGEHVKNEEALGALHQLAYDNPDMGNDQLASILEEAMGLAEEEVVEQKVQKASQKRSTKNKKAIPQEQSSISDDELEDWDDIL